MDNESKRINLKHLNWLRAQLEVLDLKDLNGSTSEWYIRYLCDKVVKCEEN